VTDSNVEDAQAWPTHCPSCGTRLRSAVIDFDKTNEDRAEFNAGEMAAVDYCPNPECPEYDAEVAATGGPAEA
jgi:hypothetical protein